MGAVLASLTELTRVFASMEVSHQPIGAESRIVKPQNDTEEALNDDTEIERVKDAHGKRIHAAVPVEIWLEIFRHATYLPHATEISPPDPFEPQRPSYDVMSLNTPESSLRTKCALVHVCRAWRQFATELLYEHLCIGSSRRAARILAGLRASHAPPAASSAAHSPLGQLPSNGIWTRFIEVRWIAQSQSNSVYLMEVFQILTECPNVIVFNMTWGADIPSGFRNAVVRMYEGTLRRLSWLAREIRNPDFTLLIPPPHCDLITPSFVSAFRALRVLDLRAIPAARHSDTEGEVLELPSVRELLVSTDPNSLAFASAFTFPALHRVRFSRKGMREDAAFLVELRRFFQQHGQSVIKLEMDGPLPRHPSYNVSHFLDGCPNLTQLVFYAGNSVILDMSSPHRSLRRIGVVGIELHHLYNSSTAGQEGGLSTPPDHQTVKTHLGSFNHDYFPNLELVRTIGFLVAASSEATTKDIFIGWTEYFEARGIDFQDGEGVVWLYDDDSAGK
ncbi:hypothetical protein BV22DRAFT_1035357 [Leucogyrophana mollusca]|uniref:Uncharacterized protein n=1 Tax=Leucogyrophana mollusca TaxID=85980 RepID=A0ACB8BEG5_9AGAM|nr:hypothetical protein BV22DRAFT_1035357 [Leucogyrophana mollusca]